MINSNSSKTNLANKILNSQILKNLPSIKNINKNTE